MDHPVKNPELDRLPADAPRQSFSAQLRAFFRRNALWFLVVALAWLLIQDVFGAHGVLAMHRSQLQLQKVQGEIKQLDEDNKKMQGDVKDLTSDPATIEGLARKMGLARLYEEVFPTEKKPADPQPDATKKAR